MALFCASAAFVLWRNSQVGVLADLAYPLNTATRIAAGDVPYRDFPLAQAPGEFLIQALLIKAFGPHFGIQIAYATLLGGLATALTYVIVLQIIRGALASPRAVAAILAFPLVPLGIYAVYPHPFYDADACLAVLIAIVAILVARDRPTPATWLVAGGLIAVPIFIKQNIGGAFLVLSVAALAAEALARVSARQGFHWCVAGIVVTLGVEILALQLFVGVDHYLRWAWTFALAGRGVSLARFREFADPLFVWPAALIVLLAFVSPFLQPRFRTPLFLAGLGAWLVSMVLAPTAFFAVPRLFPPLLIAASVLALARAWRDGPNFAALLPLVVAGTTLGTLQSLGLNGSAFGIFPMLMIAIGSLVHDLAWLIDRPQRIAPLTGIVLALVLTVAGSAYTLENFRIRFVDVNASGPVMRSAFPSLTGLSARGPYLADLDAILFWIRDNIPADEPFVFLPGEDPAYYALGRRPPLPSVYFYDVATPYSPAEIARFADDARLRWVFVKDRLQLIEEPPLEQELVAALTEHATLVARVGAYRIYRR
ncbi:MAG: hypothetical protein AUH85_11085 [Chloroflexi bacterium 13_1_40CM_4_68_4]|nr:MAG: hypothetical protein AUH85_11085 [Chloroflexi bacterium 13_1_40CM_4_68_4]